MSLVLLGSCSDQVNQTDCKKIAKAVWLSNLEELDLHHKQIAQIWVGKIMVGSERAYMTVFKSCLDEFHD